MADQPSVWGIHDLVPDYRKYKTPKDFQRAGITVGGPSGCGFYRIVLPFDELERHGWKTGYMPGQPPPESAGYRVVAAQRMDKHAALPDWRRMRLKHRLVYEIDDDIFSIQQVNWQAYRTYARGEAQDAVAHAAQVADIVTVSTEPLAEVMRARTGHRDIRVLPNCIPGGVLDVEPYRDRKHFVAGWAGGSSHGADLAMIAPALREFLDGDKRARLHLAGTDFRKTIGRRAAFTDWVPVDDSLDYYRNLGFDAGLCPLTGTVFDQSKSNIKALEYMGLGIPVLASDCEPYRGTVIDGVNGYLCRTHEDWVRRLRELANDGEARAAMGAKARETAREWTISARWRQWADVYEELQ